MANSHEQTNEAQQEPVVRWDSDGWGDLLVDDLPDGTLLYSRPNQSTQDEPVAVVSSVAEAGDKGVRVRWIGGFPQIGDRLYTRFQAREPLTKECDTCLNCHKGETGLHSFNADVCRQCCHYFDSKYEAAHGIKGGA